MGKLKKTEEMNRNKGRKEKNSQHRKNLYENIKFEEPWKIMLQNIRGLVTENSKSKVDFLNEYVKENNILMLNLTETWLNETIEEDADIEGYKIYRGDRKNRIRGGTAIYLHDKLEAIKLSEINNEVCEMVAVMIPEIQTINIVIYRPPNAKMQDFNVILNEIIEIFQKMEKPDPTIIISGDFNFPFVKWMRMSDNSCTWEYKSNSNATTEEKQQFEKLIEILNNYCILQTIEEQTREENTIDLLFTNEISLVTMIEANKSKLSDHNVIEISTTYTTIEQPQTKSQIEDPKEFLKTLNYHSKNIDWENINNQINSINWEHYIENNDMIQSTMNFDDIITLIAIENIPQKSQQKYSKKIPRERKKLINRMKMLKRGKHRAYSKEKKNELENKILETEQKILENRRREKLEKEKKVIDCMKENPRMFYSLINQQRSRKNEIGPFKINGEMIYDAKEICNTLRAEYSSQMSGRSNINSSNNIFEESNGDDLIDIDFSKKDIEDAIGQLNENSSAGPDGMPAKFLKKTKENISKPLAMLLRKSLDEGKIPEIYKLAYVTPIHKGGSRQKPEQYRPVSLTAHIMKIYERVIKQKIMQHILKNHQLNKGQHGFVPGRSTQTQLLAHYNDIYETMMEGKRLDTVFLDFAKAFDKVDHEILLKKVKKHKISGKVGNWIREFLKDRKFRVVANNNMSEEAEVISGVPQGTVLAAMLFLIMISDIDEKVKSCIVRSFADDTRVSKAVNSDEDRELMQSDLEEIYKWAKNNKMEFNATKFEQIVHGNVKDIEVKSYKDSSGELIQIKNTVKDLGILATNDILFKEHISKIINSSRVIMGMLLRTFSTRDRESMLKMFNTYIKSRLEYCCVVWSPAQQNLINEIENVQKAFTSKIKDMEGLDYHERLRELKLYSLERRRDRYCIIYGWQQLEGIKENILKLRSSWNGRDRRMITANIPNQANGKCLSTKEKNLIYNNPARRTQRLFNSIPAKLRNKTCIKTDTFKKHLDEWLKKVPDQPRGGGYSKWVAAETNSVRHQAVTLLQR